MMGTSTQKPKLFAHFSGRLPPDYDWRRSNCPDYDRFFDYMHAFAPHFEVTVFSTYAMGSALPAEVHQIRMAKPCGPGTAWHDWTLRLARLIGLSGAGWEEVCSANSPTCLRQVCRLIKRSDVYFAFGAPERAWLLNPLARLYRKRVVFDTFDDYVSGVLAGRHGLKGLLARVAWGVRLCTAYLAVKIAMRSAQLVVGSNEAHRELIRDRYGVADDRILVVHPTVNEAMPRAEDVRPRLGIARDDFVVVYMGNFATFSNRDALERLITEIAPRLVDVPSLKFLVLGAVPPELQAERANLVFAGYVKEPNSCLATANLAISPVWNSGGMIEMKIINYLMVGLPVLCTTERGNRFRTAGVRAVPISSFSEEIRRLAANRPQLAEMAAAAKEHYRAVYSNEAHHRDLDVMTDRVMERGGR